MEFQRPLGRLVPSDWRHVERYPLTLTTVPLKPTPVVLGINWYADFDTPVMGSDERAWIGRDPTNLGRLRGGHAICAKPGKTADQIPWWAFYDQGQEGACVGFAASRMMTLLNRVRYEASWLYHEAQKIDEWPGEDYDGTSVRAALDVLRTVGHRMHVAKHMTQVPGWPPPELHWGIAANRWARTVDDVLTCLQHTTASRLGAVPLVNSWGRRYPHIVWLPGETLQRLLDEDGEASLVTDR